MNRDRQVILVVDDTREVREIFELSLTVHGYDVVSASNAASGLDLARTARPDAIVLDAMMPDMDGMEFLDRLRERPSPPPVIVASGFNHFAKVAFEHGARAFLSKPLALTDLIQTIESLLPRAAV